MDTFYLPAAYIALATTHWMLRDSSSIEEEYRENKDFLPHKIVSRPVYKIARSCTNPVLSTAVSFFVTDLFMHQLPAQVAFCAVTRAPCTVQWYPSWSLAWMSFALPVMWAKGKRMMQE